MSEDSMQGKHMDMLQHTMKKWIKIALWIVTVLTLAKWGVFMQPDKKHMLAQDMSNVEHIEVLIFYFWSCLKFVDTDLLEDLEMEG